MLRTQPQLKSHGNLWLALLCAVLLAVGWVPLASAQVLPRPGRARKIQKRIERLERQNNRRGPNGLTTPPASTGNTIGNNPTGGNTTGATGLSGSAAPRTIAPPNNLTGINQSRDVTQVFTQEQKSLIIRGFGRAPALMMVFSQLNLTEGQKNEIRAISRRLGNRLAITQQELNRVEDQLELAIYGDEFEAKHVDELAAQVADKQAEAIKLRANVEAQVRQVLTPDQLFAYRYLLNEMVINNRRPAAQLLRQQLQRRGGVPPAQQNQPRPPEDN